MWQDLATSATDAEYQINTSNYFRVKKVNQQVKGGLWHLLDSVIISNSDQIKVRLLAKGNGTITADAIRIIYAGQVTNVKEEKLQIEDFRILSNYPNPFNSSTKITFYILTDAQSPYRKENVKLSIYDILGKEITTLMDDYLSTGNYEVEFDAAKYGLSSGVYFAKLSFKGKTQTIKMVYIK
jgi:hypothetical protein